MSDLTDLNKKDENTQGIVSEPIISDQTQNSTPNGKLNMNSSDEIKSDTYSNKPTVVVSGKDRINKWFYLLFVITLIVFIFITSLILKTNNSSFSLFTKNQPTVSQVVTSVVHISPSPTTTIETDSAVSQLNKLSESDNIVDLENDLENTDLKPIEESVKNLDDAMEFNPQ